MLSQKRDLRTCRPLWLDKGKPRIARSKAAYKWSDVIVVGSGVSGALVADALQSAGLSVAVVDRRNILSGSTPASTALLQSEIDTPLIELEKRIGKNKAARVWWRSAQAVQALTDRISDLGIVCDYIKRTTLYLPGNVLDAKGLKLECEARKRIGFRSELLNREELASFAGLNRPAAILTHGNAEADPVKLVAGLWRHFVKAGGTLFANTEITEIDASSRGVVLGTADGKVLRAAKVVFCTGYEIMKFAQPRGYKIASTWVLASKVQRRSLWPTQSLIWQAADPYIYMRTTADGRIIAGGEDERFSDAVERDKLTEQKIKSIARKASAIWPHADFTAEFSWAGSFGNSPNGLPAIGPVKSKPNCYAVLGFGGNGITFSMLAAQLIARHIVGISDPDAELFALGS